MHEKEQEADEAHVALAPVPFKTDDAGFAKKQIGFQALPHEAGYSRSKVNGQHRAGFMGSLYVAQAYRAEPCASTRHVVLKSLFGGSLQ